MTNKTIIQLTPLVTQAVTDIYEVSANGTGSFYETRAQMAAYFKSVAATLGNTIYVSNAGTPTGTGSVISPVQTYAQALALISGATNLNPYLVQFDSGVFTIASLQLNPWVFLSGSSVGSTYFTMSGAITLNLAAFANLTASTGITSINMSGSMTLATTGGTAASPTVYLDNVGVQGQVSITGLTADPLSVAVTNCNLSYGSHLTLVNSATLTSGGNNSFGQGITITNTAGNASVVLNNEVSIGAVISTQTGTNNIVFTASNSEGVTSVAASQASSGTNTISLDSSTWKSVSNTGGTPVFSRTDPDVIQHNLYYSTLGSAMGNGTITLPFATPNQAVALALSKLTITASNQCNIIGDAGTYTVTGLTLNPNINFYGKGVIWTGSGSIVFANTFPTAATFVTLGEIEILSGLTLSLDSSALTHFNSTITLADGFWALNSPTFKAGASPQVYNLNINDNVILGSKASSGAVVFDGVYCNAQGAHQIGIAFATGISFLTTNANLVFTSVGNNGLGTIAATATTSFAAALTILAGYVVNSGVTLTDSSTSGTSVALYRDATTWIYGTTYAGEWASTIIDLNDSQYYYKNVNALVDGATVNWNVSNSGINVSLTTGAARTIALPTNFKLGDILTLNLTSAGYQPIFASGYYFPNGAPNVNSVSGAIDTYIFQAISGSQLTLVNYLNSVPNWNNWTGLNNLPASSFSYSLLSSNGGITMTPIPGTNNLLVVAVSSTVNIKAFVAVVDSLGRITYPVVQNWTIISPTSLIFGQPQVTVLTDGLHAILSYQATTSGVSCQQLTPIAISGTSLSLGTTTQVRVTEAASGYGSVEALDTSNFSLIMRTATANKLYAYQCSLSVSTITIGSSPLTIETGNTSTIDTAQAFISSSATALFFRSTVTATASYGYAAFLGFTGTSNTPTIGALLQLSLAVNPSGNRSMQLTPFLGVTNYFIYGWTGTTNQLYLQVIENISTTPTATGSVYTSDGFANNWTMAFFQPDAKHCVAIASNSHEGGTPFIILNIDGSYNLTESYRQLQVDLSLLNVGLNFVPVNNNTMGILSYENNNTGNLYSYLTVRS